MQTNHGKNDSIHRRWQDLLGERVQRIDDADLICEVIAGQIYMIEGNKTADDVASALDLKGKDAASIKNALVPTTSTNAPAHTGSGNLPVAGGDTGSGMAAI